MKANTIVVNGVTYRVNDAKLNEVLGLIEKKRNLMSTYVPPEPTPSEEIETPEEEEKPKSRGGGPLPANPSDEWGEIDTSALDDVGFGTSTVKRTKKVKRPVSSFGSSSPSVVSKRKKPKKGWFDW